MTSARRRIDVGDVFAVPIDDRRVGFGQVVAVYKRGAYFFAIFDGAYSRDAPPDVSSIVSARVEFLALSLDALLYTGHWKTVGKAPVAMGMPLPAYKEAIGSPNRVDVVDYSGRRRRAAEADEVARLGNRVIVAPIRLENALRAQHGIGSWIDAYDELRPLEETSAKFFS